MAAFDRDDDGNASHHHHDHHHDHHPAGETFYRFGGGDWTDPNWVTPFGGEGGIPGSDDTADIGSFSIWGIPVKATIDVTTAVNVAQLNLGSLHLFGSSPPAPEVDILAGGSLTVGGIGDSFHLGWLNFTGGGEIVLDGSSAAAASFTDTASASLLPADVKFVFEGTNDTLNLNLDPTTVINSDFINFNSATDHINLANSGSPISFSYNGTTLDITTSTGAFEFTNFAFSSPESEAAFTLVSNGHGGTSLVCFMTGTLITTPDGAVPVEALAIGDPVLTSDGETKPVMWIGRQTVSRRFADPLRVLPIRIRAGALAENMPSRDLLVSPDHALLVDGVLIQAGALVNGVSIVRETRVPEIYTYYHVELADHSLILAENVPAETFVDNVERMAFDNWDEHLALYPNGLAIREMAYPRAKANRQVPQATRQRLLARGAAQFAGDAIAA
jgi:hypothetical protein